MLAIETFELLLIVAILLFIGLGVFAAFTRQWSFLLLGAGLAALAWAFFDLFSP